MVLRCHQSGIKAGFPVSAEEVKANELDFFFIADGSVCNQMDAFIVGGTDDHGSGVALVLVARDLELGVFLDAWEGIEPGKDEGSGLAVVETVVELFADFVRESGDFAGGGMSPGFHNYEF